MTRDLVRITDTHHLRIMPEGAGVRFAAMRHVEAGVEAEQVFPDVQAARAHAAAVYGVADGDWVEVGFAPFTLVRITQDDPDAEIRGRTGHVVGLSTPDSVAVMVDGLDRVWCIHPNHLVETGGLLPESERPDPSVRIRVSSEGVVL